MSDISSITAKITTLRQLTQKNSITPETVGAIMQDITDLLGQSSSSSSSSSSSGTSGSSSSNSSTSSSEFAHIVCEIKKGVLYVRGAEGVSGYTPYIFRFTKKHNHRGKNSKIKPRTLPTTKGWHLFGSMYTAKLNSDYSISFNTLENELKSGGSGTYSKDPAALLNIGGQDDFIYVSWGRSQIPLYKKNKMRIVRLKFAIAFGNAISNRNAAFDFSSLVTNLTEFTVLYDPANNIWVLSK